MHLDLALQNILVVLTLQFAVFGWRIVREIHVGDEGHRVWFPVSDWINLLSMILVLGSCVVWPLLRTVPPGETGSYLFPLPARGIFAAASVLLVFHPISMVFHYGLLSKKGRPREYRNGGQDYAYCPWPEFVVVVLALALAALSGLKVAKYL
jgi:hypothetical protein